MLLARPPVTVPFSLFLFTLVEIVCAALSLLTYLLHSHTSGVALAAISVHLAASCTLLYMIASYPLTAPAPPSESTAAPIVDPDDKNRISLPSPESAVTLLSWMSFSWVAPLIEKGNTQGRLEYRDVWSLPATMTSEGVRASAKAMGWTRLVARIYFNNSLDLTMSLVLGVCIKTLHAYHKNSRCRL